MIFAIYYVVVDKVVHSLSVVIGGHIACNLTALHWHLIQKHNIQPRKHTARTQGGQGISMSMRYIVYIEYMHIMHHQSISSAVIVKEKEVNATICRSISIHPSHLITPWCLFPLRCSLFEHGPDLIVPPSAGVT